MLKLQRVARLRALTTTTPSRRHLSTSLRPTPSSSTVSPNHNDVFQEAQRSHSHTRQKRSFSSTFLSSSSPLFDKVLIANRGEIACRVIRTCRDLGIPTVALYSVADGPNALHAKNADEAYQIGFGSSPNESYLLQDEVLEIAQKSGAKAIHPGYGFLSENAEFCQRIQTEKNGEVVFVGPPPSAITAMGSKSKSKAIMEAANVTTAPGFYGDSDEEQEPLHLLERATQDVGFPLLIKAIMGGGGKGMRLVWSESEFLEKLEACKRESLNAFGDSRVLLERYLIQPRHVEVQVVADSYGNAVSLHERDCSLQRRHQKIIEEAPASDLSDDLRRRLGEMGCRAAKAVGYVNAGTVEFLLEPNQNTEEDPDFYFCEMNTRLQVEHPITELITGIDLVEMQLRIASGEPLPIQDSASIPCQGHAFEARIYAENPGKGEFLPAAGTVWHHDPPAPPNEIGIRLKEDSTEAVVRVDTGIQVGQEVGVYYDPMICKLIVHDETRSKALDKLVAALKRYRIAGVPTNIDFLIRCAEHEIFRTAGATNTGFLDDHMDEVLPPASKEVPHLAIAIGTFATMLQLEGRVGVSDLHTERRLQTSPWNSLSGSWRNGGKALQKLELPDGTSVECTALRDGSYDIRVIETATEDEEPKRTTSFHINGMLSSDEDMELIVNGSQKVALSVAMREMNGRFQICMWPQSLSLLNEGHYFWELSLPNPRIPSSTQGDKTITTGRGTVSAPMPGKISQINFGVGDTVQEGDVLVVMEAMKMEHTVTSPATGVVTKIAFEVNDVVPDGAVLAVVENNEETDDDNDEEAV